MKILVTGASGFIGSELVNALAASGNTVRAAVRRPIAQPATAIEQTQITGLTAEQDWTEALLGIDVVIHCAARVHVMNEATEDPLAAFRAVNVEGTRRLAQQAADSNVRRFIFLSSVKVNGEATPQGTPFRSSDKPQPEDPYGVSKWEAEQALHQICAKSTMDYTIIRPVLVYGPGVKANFAQLVKITKTGLPLPLRNTRNKRSIVALENLVDLIAVCTSHPQAANQTFLVSDGEDLSTSELITEFAISLGKEPRLIPFPKSIAELAATLLGKRDVVQRLLGSLQVDISHTRNRLGWGPPSSTKDCIRRTVESICRS